MLKNFLSHHPQFLSPQGPELTGVEVGGRKSLATESLVLTTLLGTMDHLTMGLCSQPAFHDPLAAISCCCPTVFWGQTISPKSYG